MKLYITILAVGFIYLATSCSEDFLDTEPITTKTDGNYYTTPEEAQEALVGCYDGLQRNYQSVFSIPVSAVTLSDLCFGGTGATDANDFRMLDEFDKDVAPSYMNIYNDVWVNCYKTIFRCNMLLSRLDQVDWGKNPELAVELEAEARFIRAYTYYDMVRMFGRIPLLTEPSSENIPQSEPDEVYEAITSDLLFCIDNASKLTYSQIASADYGHATKWSAEALLARVYLFYTGYYGKNDLLGLVTKIDALSYVEDIITNSGYGLIDNYYNLWLASARYQSVLSGRTLDEHTYAGETHKEIVFSVRYTFTSNLDGNNYMIMNGLRLQKWEHFGYDYGWGANTVSPDLYTNWNPNDDRRDASIMGIEEESIDFTQIIQAKEYTGYYTKKYIPLCNEDGSSLAMLAGGASNQTGQYQDYFAIRYSDILLMAAELGSGNALSYVNEVRERAHATPVTSVDKDIIYEERKLELAFEGHRYWDLLRYDNTLTYAAEKVSYNGMVLNGDIPTEKIIDGAKLIATKGLFQIPYDQITLSDGVLEQNAGW